MHSMLRQNQVRQQDVKPYIRSFTRSNPMDLNEWAKEEGGLFEPGTLIFLLEPAKRPPGMTSFARDRQAGPADTGDGYRVKDMCVVVDKIDGKCWVLAISPSAFELRFIDTLFREKTQKAFLEGLDFNYLAAQPRPALNAEKLKDLRQLSTLYSKSGSRRTIAQDGTGPDEPAKAMLAFLGADLSATVGKQVIELGLICNMIFAPEGVQENKAQSMVKSCFTPILATDKLKGQAPAPPPSTTAIIENQALLDDEVSLLSPSYLESEAREAEDHLKYNPPPADTSAGWTSTPAAAGGSDEFQPLGSPPPFDIGGMVPPGATASAPPNMVQPSLSLSPDIPAILTGEHKVITLEETLGPTESNGTKIPSLPAWYMTTHDVEMMNEVALKRAQEAPASMPEGLDKLESELSYDALPVVDARFREGGPPPVQELPPIAELPTPTALSAEPTAALDASGAWAAPALDAGSTEDQRDFVDSIFAASGGRGSLEINPDAANAAPKRSQWQPVEDDKSAGTGFVSPGSTAKPAPDSSLFNRLGGGSFQAEEDQPPRSFTEAGTGRPTNLKDMLTVDSAVFSTSDRGKLQDITPPQTESAPASPEPEPVSAEPAVQAEAETAQAVAQAAPESSASLESEPTSNALAEPPTATAAAAASADGGSQTESADLAPAPWMNLAPIATPATEAAPAETAATELSAQEEETTPSSAAWEAFSESSVSAPTPDTQDNYNELQVALNGLMESPEATEPAPPRQDAAEFTGTPDLFSDVMDKVMDLAEASPAQTAQETAQEIEQEPVSMFEDSRAQTQDLDTAMFRMLASGPASLTANAQDSADNALPAQAEEEITGDSASAIPAEPAEPEAILEETEQQSISATETVLPEPEAPISSLSTEALDSSLVSPAMAAHAQAMTEAETPSAPPELSIPETSNLTPLRPGRRRPSRDVSTPPAIPPSTPDVEASPAAESTAPGSSLREDKAADSTTLAESVEPISASPDSVEATAGEVELQGSGDTNEIGTPSSTETPSPAASSDTSTAGTSTPMSSAQSTSISDSAPPVASQDVAAPQSTDTSAATAEPLLPTQQDAPGAASQASRLTISQETAALAELDALEVGEEPTQEPEKIVPYELDAKITASGLKRAQQPAVEPKLVISESTRFMARLNQRLSEADKKLSSRCDQSRDRLLRELDALVEEAHKVERQNGLSTGALTEQLMTHLETVSQEVMERVKKTASESCEELTRMSKDAEAQLAKLEDDLQKELENTQSTFQADCDGLSESTRVALNQHAQNRIDDFNTKLEEVAAALEGVYDHHIEVLTGRFEKFQARLNEEVEAIISALDRNVGSMTVEIDGSWDRASEKLAASQTEFGNSVNYLVHSCRAELKQVHLESYARQVLPRLLENKDIFRTMLLDMKRNFEEQSDKHRKQQLRGLAESISSSKAELDTLTKECLSTIESVGKGQQFGLEELYNSTSARLEEIISTVESKLKTAKQQITDNDEASLKTSEASRVEDEPAFSREKQQAIAALNEARTTADNALETNISTSSLNLEQLSEDLQEDLAKQRQDWTAQVRATADENIQKVKQAIQDAFQAIETTKERYMD